MLAVAHRECPMPDSDSLDDYIAATARLLDLTIDPAWQPAVRANLELTLRLAAVVAEFPLPDEVDAAPVFEA
jgi:Protein of unknown function (DUF4089)